MLNDNPQPGGVDPEIDTVPLKSGRDATVTIVERLDPGVACKTEFDFATRPKSAA